MVPVGRAQRSGAVIEYRLSDQWFVRMKPLAEKALAASGYVRRGDEWVSTGAREIFFHPPRWEKIYFDWLSRIRDWTISRQIWWGHRIPAWYHKETGEILVDVDTPKKVRENPDAWYQDEDVLDTWFSSWLWPMTTLGWPEETPDLKRYFPTSVLSTAKDIIFFWVARMNFASLEMTGQLPYRDVYIHPTVLDERGATMSKVKGNGIDPLAVIDGATREELTGPILEARPENAKELLVRVEKNFPEGFEGVGADALRFTLVHTCSEGQELRLSLQRFHDIGRRFVTKLWNASRYALLTLEAAPGPEAGEAAPTVEDRWIVSRTATTIREVRRGIESFDFGTVGQELYRFVWNDYCDWYLELTKPRISGDDPAAARRAAHVLGTTLAQILRMLHPVTPFITEELWSMLLPAMDAKDLWMGKRPESELLVLEKTPVSESEPDLELEARFESLQRLVGRIRTSRANARARGERRAHGGGPAAPVGAPGDPGRDRDGRERAREPGGADARRLAAGGQHRFRRPVVRALSESRESTSTSPRSGSASTRRSPTRAESSNRSRASSRTRSFSPERNPKSSRSSARETPSTATCFESSKR